MNYSELQTLLANFAARSDLTADIPTLIDLTTAMFNHGQQSMRPLRVREMETVDDLSPTAGVYTLPADYLQYRRVVELASIRRELEYTAPEYADQRYPDRASGLSNVFTIVGSSLYSFPVSSNDIELTYYQAIPDLSVSNTTNWLLTKQPNAYLHGGLFQISMITKDNSLFDRSAAMLASIMDGLVSSDVMANYARAATRVKGMTP